MIKLLFWLSRLKPMGTVIGFIISNFSVLLPVKKIYENKFFLCFYHPVPFFKQFHILFVPKKIIKTMLDIKSVHLYAELINAVYSTIEIIGYPEKEATVFINGGNRQDVMQVHFHFSYTDILKDKHMHFIKLSDIEKQSQDIDLNKSILIEMFSRPELTSDKYQIQETIENMISNLLLLNDKFSLKNYGYTLYISFLKNDNLFELNKIFFEINK